MLKIDGPHVAMEGWSPSPEGGMVWCMGLVVGGALWGVS